MKTTHLVFLSILIVGFAVTCVLAQNPWPNAPNWFSNDENFTMSVAVGDVDGDGDLDMICGNYKYPYDNFVEDEPEKLQLDEIGGGLYGYENFIVGADAFLDSDPYPLITGYCVESVALADYDKDGDLDVAMGLIVGKGGDGGVMVANNQDLLGFAGNFSTADIWKSDLSYDCPCVRWVDFDSDGDLDLAALEIPGIVHIYPNNMSVDEPFGDPISFNLQGENESYKGDPRDDLSNIPFNWVLEGTTMEFGDIVGDGVPDPDGKLDLLVNVGTLLTVFPNLFDPSPSFNLENTYHSHNNFKAPNSDKDDIFCASFGRTTIGSYDKMVVAVGSRTIGGLRGNSIFIAEGTNGLTKLRDSDEPLNLHQSVTDIQWANLNDGDEMDIVAVSFPVFKKDGQNTSWDRGLELYHENPSDLDFPSTEINTVADLSTSLVLGDIDGGDLNDVIDEPHPCWSGGLNEFYGFTYLDHFPFLTVSNVKWSDANTSLESIPDTYWCFNPQDGWVSVDKEFIDDILDPEDFFTLHVTYSYSDGLDLIIGNDGKNVYYTNGASSGTTPSEPNASLDDIPFPPNGEFFGGNLVQYKYTEDFPPYWSNTDPHVNLMAKDGLGASFAFMYHPPNVSDYLTENPNIKRIGFEANWHRLETYPGHYYWDWLDKNINRVVDDYSEGRSTHLSVWWFPFWTQGNFILDQPPGVDDYERNSDERLHTLFIRNLINRYRPYGVMATSSANEYAYWQDFIGTEVFQFTNEPNTDIFGYGPYSTSIDAIVEQMFFAYQMLKDISANAYPTDPNKLKMCSPNPTKAGAEMVGQHACPDMPYLNVLNSTVVNDITINLQTYTATNALWEYCDYISQQVYSGTKGVGTPTEPEWLHYEDPVEPTIITGTNLKFGFEQYFWGWYTPGLDSYLQLPGNWDPVMYNITLDQYIEKPFYIYESSFTDDWETHVWDDYLLPQSSWTTAQIPEMFSVDVFPDNEYVDHYLVAYHANWSASDVFSEIFNEMAGILNTPGALNDTSDYYFAGFYEIPGVGDDPPMYQYTFKKAGTKEKLHFLKTEWDTDDGITDNAFITTAWNFTLENEGNQYGTTLDTYFKAGCYTMSGNYFEKDIVVMQGGPKIPFSPGEMGPGGLIIHEGDPPKQKSTYTQTITLHEGWNLMSWHLNIPDPNPFDPPFWLEIDEVLPDDQEHEWFHGTEPGQWVGELYKHTESQLYYPDPVAFMDDEEWNLDNAYYIHMEKTHTWDDFEDQLEYWPLSVNVNIETSFAWDDHENAPTSYEYANDWFFMGYAAPGYCKLASIPDQLPPAQLTDDGNPLLFEYEGPFHDLIWDPLQLYNLSTLKIIKDDMGRAYIPDPDPINHRDNPVDDIVVLEPGKGYFLGFSEPENTTFDGWHEWPQWQDNPPTFNPDPKSGEKEIASTNHFQYNKYTHWSYPVYIDTVDLEECPMENGDEIGVFDGDDCVGASVYQGEFPLIVTCWEDDKATPMDVDGYIDGNPMIFIWYDLSENAEIEFQLSPMTASKEEDDRVAPQYAGFGMGLYAYRIFMEGSAGSTFLPKEFSLKQNYPNPFNSSTIIPLELPQRSRVTIDLFDVCGRLVWMHNAGVQNAGWPNIHFNASNLASGVYFYRLTADGLERGGTFTSVNKMLLLK